MKNFTKLFLVVSMLLFVSGLSAQAVVNCNSSTLATGSVTSAGVKSDGHMVNINSGASRGWANFTLPTAPSGMAVGSVTAKFTTYTSTSSTAANNLYAFLGDPSTMAGTALYTACASGTSINATSWTANALNTKALTAAAATFIQANLGNSINIGYVRGSTNNYNVYGYPAGGTPPTLEITWVAACSGTPNAGTAAASVASACASTSFNLSLTGQSTDPGIVYQWQSSPAGAGTWTNIAGATTNPYAMTQTVASDYRCVVTCTGSGSSATSTTVSVGQNGFLTCYCASAATSTADEDLGNVIIGSLTNNGTCATLGGGSGSILNRYSNWTNLTPPEFPQGASIAFSFQGITCGGNYDNRIYAWVDFNQDGDYTDAGENVWAGAVVNGPHTDAGTFTVPVGANLGVTGMRVMIVEQTAALTPCLSYSWGETEDYYVNVVVNPNCSGMPTGGTASGPASACSGTNFSLSLSGYTVGTGITFQWQKSPVGAGTWTDIAGATTAVYSTNQTAASDYRCAVTCTNSGMTAYSTTASVTMTPVADCYCVSIPSNAGDEEIGDITIGALVNASNCTTLAPGPGSILNRYSNYKTLAPTDMQIGSTQNFTLNILTCGGNYGSKTAIYIDWNQDGDWVDVGEEAYVTAAATTGPHVVTGSFVVPGGATVGVTGMRVINVETTGTITPCMAYGYGETEDYLVNITPPPPCTGVPASGSISGVNQVCTGQTTTLTVAGYDPLGTITLQWKESTDNVTFTNIAGATAATYTSGALAGNVWYKVAVTCGASGETSETAAYAITVGVAQGGTVNGPTPITLGFTYTYNVTGYFGAIQWQSSTDGTTYTNITGATSSTQPLGATVAGTYYLRVRTNLAGCVDTAYSAPIIIVAQVAGNDPVCGIIDVPVDGVNHGPYSNVGATTQTGEPVPPGTNCAGPKSWCNTTLSNTVWFSFVAPASGHVKVESFMVTGSNDNQLALYSAADCNDVLSGNAILLAANDDANSGGLSFMAAINSMSCLTPGVTYYLQMDAYTAGSTGTYNFKITELPAPDATYSGLPATICMDGGSVTLTPVTSGGTFTGPGMSGTTFNPATAGAGTHTIIYQLASPSLCTTSQTVDVIGLTTYYPDADGDGFGDGNAGVGYCATAPPANWITQGDDCNDNDININPLATDICNNSVDENCDGDDNSVEGFNMDITPDCKSTLKNKVLISGVSGGLGGYLYSRDGGAQQSNPLFSNIPAGPHTFTVHAGDGCDLVQSLELEPNMTLTPAVVNVSCYGLADGEATVGIAGGYAPYSYTWFKGSTQISTDEMITDLVASTYKVNVLDNEGCLVKATAIVTQPPKMNVKTVPTNVSCAGGSNGQIFVNNLVLGGVGPFSFSWSNGGTGNPLTGIPAGAYTVIVTDLGTGALCTASAVEDVTQPFPLEIDTITMKPVKCFGGSNGSAKAKAGGGTGTRQYNWNTTPPTLLSQSIINQPAGVYTVTVNDVNGCTTTGSIQITQPTVVVIENIYSVPNPAGGHDISAIISGGTPTYKLASQMITPTLGDTSAFKGLQQHPLATLKKLPAGTYKFFAQDKNKCQVNTAEMAIPIALKPAKGRDEKADLVKATNFRLVPNPTTSSVQLVFDGNVPTGGVVEIHSASGQLVQRIEAAAIDQNSIRVENLPAGVLMVTYSADNQRVTKRLVVLN